MDAIEFHKINDQLTEVSSLNDVKICCEKFCELCEFEYYIFAICKATSLSTPQISTLTNYPASWFSSYFELELQKYDPVVKYSFENTAPICWDKLIKMEQYLTPEAVQIMEDAAAKGLVNGISIPFRTHTGEINIFSLATDHADNFDTRAIEVLSNAQLFGTTLFSCVSRIQNQQDSAKEFNFTPREVECLFWACEGKTTWEMSVILEVSERTVIFHLTSATKKLGAVNRQHAVAKAIMCGLIKPKP